MKGRKFLDSSEILFLMTLLSGFTYIFLYVFIVLWCKIFSPWFPDSYKISSPIDFDLWLNFKLNGTCEGKQINLILVHE
jgi:hypothetical protein